MVGHNHEPAYNTVELESRCGRSTVWSSGEMLRDNTEHRLRRQLTKLYMTLRHEGVGSKEE